jgi:hypothetical protein
VSGRGSEKGVDGDEAASGEQAFITQAAIGEAVTGEICPADPHRGADL